MRRRVHFGKILVCFALLLLMPFYQNCQEASFDGNPTKPFSGTADSGNGGVYEGKPEPGEYYRIVPGSECHPQTSIHSVLHVSETSATLETYAPSSCQPLRKDVSFSSLEANAQNRKLIGLEGIYEKQVSRPVAQPEQITEMWCLATGLNAEPIDVVIRHKQSDATTTAELQAKSGSKSARVSRNLKDGVMKYDSSDFAIAIDLKNASALEKVPGRMTLTGGAQIVSYELDCRTGGVLDRAQPTLPTLALDFSRQQLPSTVQFSRASSGTYVDQNGILRTAGIGAPRFGHEPMTKEPRGLLIEKAATNLFAYSTDFQSVDWVKSHAIVRAAPEVVAPDGTLTAMKLIDSANLENHEITASYTLPATPASHYTCSFFVKGAERYSGRVSVFKVGTNNAFEMNWNTSLRATAPSTRGTGVVTSHEFTEYPNGWFRVSVSGQVEPTPSGGVLSCRFILGELRGNYYYTGDGTSGHYIWGAQLEAGAEPTSYIATNGTAVTRASDSVYVGSMEWVSPTQGTFVANASRPWGALQPGRRPTMFSMIGASNAEISLYSSSPGSVRALVAPAAATSTDWQIGAPASASGSLHFALGYGAGDTVAASNGSLTRPSMSPAAIDLTPSNFWIGGSSDTQKWNGAIKAITYWPTRLEDSMLVDLSR